VAFYLPPVLDEVVIHHAQGIKNKFAKNKSILPDENIYRRLDRPELWHDGVHLTTAGSKIYTPWLAEQIIREGLLKK
jgi:hypothetical protein